MINGKLLSVFIRSMFIRIVGDIWDVMVIIRRGNTQYRFSRYMGQYIILLYIISVTSYLIEFGADGACDYIRVRVHDYKRSGQGVNVRH